MMIVAMVVSELACALHCTAHCAVSSYDDDDFNDDDDCDDDDDYGNDGVNPRLRSLLCPNEDNANLAECTTSVALW